MNESNVPKDIPESFDNDTNYIMNHPQGCVDLVWDIEHGNISVPTDLMNGGHHFDGIHCHVIQRSNQNNADLALQRTALHDFIPTGNWERPRRTG